MDSEIKMLVKICDICQSHRHRPPVLPLHPWEWPEEPWSCIHIVLVDTYSKWLDAHITSSSTSQITAEKMSQTFANMGLPKMVVSDNDYCFYQF